MIVKIQQHNHGGSEQIVDMCDPAALKDVSESLHFFDDQNFPQAMTNFLNSVGGGWGSAKLEYDGRDHDIQIEECLKAIKKAQSA